MIKIGAIAAVIIGSAFLMSGSPAQAQLEGARKACCLKMGGTWRADYRNRGDAMYCYDLGRSQTDEFYKCAAGGGKKK
jgi:hypothetical protein